VTLLPFPDIDPTLPPPPLPPPCKHKLELLEAPADGKVTTGDFVTNCDACDVEPDGEISFYFCPRCHGVFCASCGIGAMIDSNLGVDEGEES